MRKSDGRGWCRAGAALLAAAFTPAAFAASHALIMAIDAYQGPNPLPGVKFDGSAAEKMAVRMGIPQENIAVRTNAQLTVGGMRSEMKALAERVASGDQVFVFYSGHGARVRDPKAASGCSEALVAVNGDLLPHAEFGQWIATLTQKAERVIVMNDSCFSGGPVTRGASQYKAKYYKAKGDAECDRPLNIRMFFEKPGEAGKASPPLNPKALYIAASGDNEVSFAGPNGSVGTLAWLDCLASAEARQGKPPTAEELRACAQKRIDDDARNPPQRVTVFGNRDAPLSFGPAQALKKK